MTGPAFKNKWSSARSRLGIAFVLVAAVFLPAVLTPYHLFQCTLLLTYAIAILGLDILTGFCGQVSIGHSAFFAVGAYVAAIFMDRFGWPYWSTILPAGLGCFGLGFFFGFPALRLKGMYLALATFALSVAFPEILKFTRIEDWTGGVQGIVLEKPAPPSFLPISADSWIYMFVLAVSVLMFLLARNLLRSRIGYGLIAIRDNPLAASAMGVNVSLYKTTTFGLSALYAGIAGALQCISVQFVAPDSFTVFLSISFIVGMVIGGMGTIYGALIGALFIEFAPEVSGQISKAAPGVVYGLILILFIYVSPGGIIAALPRLFGWFRGKAGALC